MTLEQGGARAGSGSGPHAHDFTARDARKDFLSFLGHMVTSAQKAHDTVEKSARARESGVEVGWVGGGGRPRAMRAQRRREGGGTDGVGKRWGAIA
jgi:hypothetical protein